MKEEEILDVEIRSGQKKPVNLLLLGVVIIMMSTLIGATTNIVNGNLSEEYFRQIMGWDFEGIWKAAILQGVLEGVMYGIIFGLIYVIGFRIITKGDADWSFVIRQLYRAVLIVYILWFVGGLFSVLQDLNYPSPPHKLLSVSIPEDKIPRMKFMWVRGSIYGAVIGGLISVFYSIFRTSNEWKKSQDEGFGSLQ